MRKGTTEGPSLVQPRDIVSEISQSETLARGAFGLPFDSTIPSKGGHKEPNNISTLEDGSPYV